MRHEMKEAFTKLRWNALRLAGRPVTFPLPGQRTLQLYPAGQIPRLMFTHNFEHDDIEKVMLAL